MVGTLDMFSGRTVASSLSSVASMSARPTFELQFAMLQNALIDRINKKIEEVNAEDGNRVDAFQVLERVRLSRLDEAFGTYRGEVNRVSAGINAIYADLVELSGKVDAAAVDANEFDTILGRVNQIAEMLSPVNGIPVGDMTDDGIKKMRADGVVQITRDGATVAATKYSDFTDPDEAKAAILAAINRASASVSIIEVKAETAAERHEAIRTNLSSVRLEIEAQKTTATAEKAAKVTELEEQYATLLKTLSIAFEGQQAMADHMAKRLFEPPELDRGSVINLFT